MELIKYSSIENTYRDKFLHLIKEQGQDHGEWVVMEKVHGGQFSIYYDGKDIRASSRTTFLDENTDFFNWQKVLNDNKDKVIHIYRILQSEQDLSILVVYGELFGGSYPHPDVAKVKTAKRLQKGVFYHPDNLFYAFDIRVDGHYLDVDRCEDLFRQSAVFYARTLFRGPLDKCIQYPDTFPSKISQWLGLPSIEDNIAEGIVIKPVDPRFLKTGDRVILKSKNEKFKERKAKKKRPPKPTDAPLSPQAQELQQELEALVTENRFQNVLSKRGDIPYPLPKDFFGQMMKDFSADIWEEFNKDFAKPFDSLDKKEQKRVSKAINQIAAKMVQIKLFSK